MTRTRYLKAPVEADSDQSTELRRPLTNLQNLGPKSNRICSRQQKEKIDVTYKGNEEKSENVNTVFRNELKNGCENQEININVKPVLDDKAIQYDFTEADVNFKTNPLLIIDIYFHMKECERKNDPLFRKSKYAISKEIRSSIIDWFIYTSVEFKFDTETFHLAVYYADRYLSKEEAAVGDLLLVGTCAILLACKHEEARDNIPEMDDLIKNVSGAFHKHEILKMEQRILKVLDFKLSYSTAYQFLQIFCSMYNIKGEQSFLAQYLCDIALIHEEIYFYTEPSRIAAASLALSNYLLNINPRFNDIEVLSGYDENNLRITTRLLFEKFDKIPSTQFRSLKSKYRSISEKSYPTALHI